MAERMTKWVAGFDFDGSLMVARCQCRKTAKLFVLTKPSNGEERRAQQCIGYRSRLDHDNNVLHDSAKEALNALRARQQKFIIKAQRQFDKLQERLDQIEAFNLETLT